MLWLIGSLLVALALAFTVWPLLRAPATPRSEASRRALMSALYRDRVAELERETHAGQLDPETRAEVERELGANLLDEYQQTHEQAVADDDAARGRGARSGARLAAGLVLFLVPLLGTAVYLSAGEPDAVSVAGATEVLRLDPQRERAEIERWRDRLARRVANRPADAQSWYLLGMSHLQLAEFAAAAEAFGRARAFAGDDLNVDTYWLQSRYLAAGGVLDDGSRDIAERVLAARPNDPMVLEMYAIEAYRAGDFRQAVGYLNRALSNPLRADQARTLLAGMDQARSRMTPLTPSVDVRVDAATAAPAGATVFVVARPPGGGMPYAVVRRPAALLPLDVRLDDAVSMSQARPLSAAGPFEVVVRLSRRGTAAPGPDDWEWRSDPIDPAELGQPLALEARLAPPTAGNQSLAASAAPASSSRDPVRGSAIRVAVPRPDGAPPGTTLYVIARPPGGGMPYAVVRRPAAELPVEVGLDDSASMTGNRRLSEAAEFEVVVRLSASGNAMPGPGDWEWRSGVIDPAEADAPRILTARLTPRPTE